jgi:flagellar basal body rod protein FlgG
MGLGDLSFSAVASLRSIDEWIATLNGNMAGAGRVGFKATRVKFDGGATSSLRPTVSPTLGVHIAEQSLGIVQTTLDFSQGAITASTDFTHLAIQQTGAAPAFFVLNTRADGAGTNYYTRDGEFHFNTEQPPRLVNNQGLYVMSNDGGANGDAVTLIDDGDTNSGELNVTVGALTGDEDVLNGQILLDRLRLQIVNNPQLELQFSRYGSTIFEVTAGVTLPAPAIGGVVGANGIDSNGNYTDAANNIVGRVVPNSLEASNASLTQTVPELALAQKMYEAMAKLIQVSLSNIDAALALVR